MRRTMMLLALLVLALPGYGQDTDNRPATPSTAPVTSPLKDLISGTSIPLSLKLKDLNSDWRRVTIGGQFDMAGFMQMFNSMFGGAGANTYYTNGQIVPLGSESYIVAYHVQTKPINFMAVMQAGPNAKPPAPEKLTPDTTLTLALLNLRTTGSLTDIRPFDINQEIAESGGSEQAGTDTTNTGTNAGDTVDASLSNLKQLGQALKTYAQENDATLPPMQDMTSLKQALVPYLKSDAAFTDPMTSQPYQANTILSRHKVAHIINPTEMVTFYEASPAPDNTRGIVTLDGQIHRISEAEWPLWKKRSKIP